MPIRIASRVEVALREKQIVRFTRPFEEGSVSGYVLDVGPRWFLLLIIDDGMYFNGFQCLRLSDVRGLQVPHPYAAFAKAALKKRGERPPRKPRVDLGNIRALLLSVDRQFPLVTIHRERAAPGICEIGHVVHADDRRVSLHEINPDAGWDGSPKRYRLNEITRVDFGGDYEEALYLVGGSKDPARRRK
ncbi:MAG TPA: hypothetical protein VFB66_15290 [Tepidisphaeraceae bacterium]|nr:hypothetical protein [Tepidisphaeraceae bacterium]